VLLYRSFSEQIIVNRCWKVPDVKSDEQVHQENQTQMLEIFLEQTCFLIRCKYLFALKEPSDAGMSGEEDSENRTEFSREFMIIIL
jgi:hypothetical protein